MRLFRLVKNSFTPMAMTLPCNFTHLKFHNLDNSIATGYNFDSIYGKD